MSYIYARKKQYVGAHFHSKVLRGIKKTKYFCTDFTFQNGEMLFLEQGLEKRETLPWWNREASLTDN